MTTQLAYLPPLPPIAVARPAPTPLVSDHASAVITAAVVLLAGISALAWAFRLDATDNQMFVTAAATWTVFAPAATLALLHARLRR